MRLPSLKSAEVANKTVLVRADLDVPFKKDERGQLRLADDFRIQRALPTIQYLIEKNAKVIVLAHLGRPKGHDPTKTLLPVAERLSGLLKYKFLEIGNQAQRLPHYPLPHLFFFHHDIFHDKTAALLADLNPKDVAVLENLRFYSGEDELSEEFAKRLAALGEVFVNDAFASSHTERASVTLLPKFLPAYAGLELEKEVSALLPVVLKPDRPYVVVAGGIKLVNKMEGLEKILERADTALIGGGLASLFFSVLGYHIGKSVIDEKSREKTRELLRNFRNKIQLPVDVVVARSPEEPQTLRVVSPDKISPSEMILDIGPKTINKFSAVLKSAATIVWSGPMGLFEIREFSHGTRSLGRLIASRGKGLAYAIAGGGDTLEAVRMIQMGKYFDYLSTGGSAMLQFLAGKQLPGLEALKKHS